MGILDPLRRATVRTRVDAIDYYQRDPMRSLLRDLAIGTNRMPEAASLPAGERSYVLEFLGADNCPVPAANVIAWHNADPTGFTAAAVCHVLVRDAWAARGRRVASETSKSSFDVFFEMLRRAEEFVNSAVAQWPGEIGVLSAQLTLIRGLQGPRAKFDRVLAVAHEIDPWDYLAANAHIQFVAPKWYGTSTEVVKAARFYLNAPEGSAVRGLIAGAHIEVAISDHQSSFPNHISADDFAELGHELMVLTRAHKTAPVPAQLRSISTLVHALWPKTPSEAEAVLAGIATLAGRAPRSSHFRDPDHPDLWFKVIQRRESQAKAVLKA